MGIVAATCAQLAMATLDRSPMPWLALLIFIAGLIGAWRWQSKVATPVVLMLGGVSGWLLV